MLLCTEYAHLPAAKEDSPSTTFSFPQGIDHQIPFNLISLYLHPHILASSALILLFIHPAIVAYAVAYPLLIVLYSHPQIVDAHACAVLNHPPPMKLCQASATILLLTHHAMVDLVVST